MYFLGVSHLLPTVPECNYMIDMSEQGSTHCGLGVSYDDINLGQHWLRQWLVAWWHQAITWTNVDLSLARICGICLRAILQWVHKVLLCMSFKIILSLPNIPEGQWVKLTSVYIMIHYIPWNMPLIFVLLCLFVVMCSCDLITSTPGWF